MTEGVKLIFWIAGVHILGLACVAVLLLPALRDDSANPTWSDGEADDGGGGGAKTPPSRPEPPSGGIPLPDSVPAGVRLRDHDRLGDKLPLRERRPVREPVREPAPRVPARNG
jgi:hypothetical protein